MFIKFKEFKEGATEVTINSHYITQYRPFKDKVIIFLSDPILPQVTVESTMKAIDAILQPKSCMPSSSDLSY